MMKNKVLPILLFATSFLFGQNKLYYVEIPDENNVPKITTIDGKTVISHNDIQVRDIFSKHGVINLEKAFPTSKMPYLRTIYLLETKSAGLISDLNKYKQYFPYTEETYKGETLLYTPNDYDLIDPVYHHRNFDLINLRTAWDYSTGDPNFNIGISDSGINTTHEDLQGKVTMLTNVSDWHGTSVAGIAAAATDNNIGMAGIGFNSKVLFKYMYDGAMMNTLLVLSQNGARVVNASWYNSCSYSSIDQLVIDEVHQNGTVIVVAAGNGGTCGGPDNYVYPASYNHVISVSSVGFAKVGNVACCGSGAGLPFNWEDRVGIGPGVNNDRHQTNDMVDLRAPGYDVVSLFDPNYNNQGTKYTHIYGTSIAAPQVSGVVSLMLTANSCLNTEEVETILKLTSARLDNIQENQPYLGKLGAGRIDAGEATKIAWQMNPANGGEVLIKNRNFEKWDFELTNSPESIRIQNESFTQNANVKFKAKKSIILDTNTVLEPGNGKSHYFYIENQNTCFNFNPNQNKSLDTGKIAKNSSSKIVEIKNEDITLYPIPAKDNLFIKTTIELKNSTIKIFDISNRLVLENKISIINTALVDISNLLKGTYFIEITNDNSKLKYFKKFVKE
ncbi:S8 family peptidase [Chryseobacterium sp. VD8]|uniref:S8 family peptidase n=1 Tax=Chryseobacterium sp. VD8 TaxID=3081254 RepID=UPI00301838AD